MLRDDNNILKFDLKGSLVNRKTKVPPWLTMRSPSGNGYKLSSTFKTFSFSKTLKDQNFLEIDNDFKQSQDYENRVKQLDQSRNGVNKNKIRDITGIINISEKDIVHLRKTISSDTSFLQSLNIMDYSLYLVIE